MYSSYQLDSYTPGRILRGMFLHRPSFRSVLDSSNQNLASLPDHYTCPAKVDVPIVMSILKENTRGLYVLSVTVERDI